MLPKFHRSNSLPTPVDKTATFHPSIHPSLPLLSLPVNPGGLNPSSPNTTICECTSRTPASLTAARIRDKVKAAPSRASTMKEV